MGHQTTKGLKRNVWQPHTVIEMSQNCFYSSLFLEQTVLPLHTIANTHGHTCKAKHKAQTGPHTFSSNIIPLSLQTHGFH